MKILLGLALMMLIAACEGRLDGDPGEVAEPPAAEDSIPTALLPRFTIARLHPHQPQVPLGTVPHAAVPPCR